MSRLMQMAEEKAHEGEWIQLFNGKDLSGWTPKIRGYELGNNFGNTFLPCGIGFRSDNPADVHIPVAIGETLEIIPGICIGG